MNDSNFKEKISKINIIPKNFFNILIKNDNTFVVRNLNCISSIHQKGFS